MSNPHANHQGEPGDTGTGWVLVPREPTPKMLSAGQRAADDKTWAWRGLGPRPDGTGIDGQTFFVRDAFRAMIASAPTAPDQVGEDVGRELLDLAASFDQSGKTLISPEQYPVGHVQGWKEAHACCARDLRTLAAKIASAPSPDPAGADGDLGELERLSAAASQGDIIAEPYTDDHGGCYLMAGEIQIAAGLTEEDGAYLAALARDHRSGKLVASTGSEEETKGAGSLGPLNWQLSEEAQAHIREIDLATVRPDDPRLSQTLIGPAGPAAGMDGYGSQARPLTPQQSPSPTTETDPPMSVEEAREVLKSVVYGGGPLIEYVDFLRGEQSDLIRSVDYRRHCRMLANRIEAALRTLQAAGEVRHDQ